MKRVLSLTLAFALCFSIFSSVKADELTSAQKDYQEIQDSINGKKEELNGINKQKDSTQKTMEELDRKMDETTNKLTSINNNIENVNKEINEQKNQIEETEKAIEEGNELLKRRVRAMYINGSESYLEMLLSSNSFSDFISRVDTVSKLMEYDRNIITGMEQKSEELNNAKVSLEEKKSSMVVLKSTADKEYKALDADSDKKKEFMTQLEKDKVKYEELIQGEQQESEAIGVIIKNIMQRKAEEAKRKAEEAKKKAEEAKKNAQSNNRGGSTSSAGSVLTSTDSSIGKLYCVTGKPYVITSPFGTRFHPILKKVIGHEGIDIGVNIGTPIYALAGGEVIYSGTMSGYGNVVMIDHGNLTTLYAHNSSLVVKVGQTVKGGQLITYSGNTGRSTGPHLHFEVRDANGTAINPMKYYVR